MAAVDRAPETASRQATVLLAEDDFELRSLLVQELSEDGHEVIALENGAELFDWVFDGILGPRSRPDVIVSDVRMPGFDGLSVLRHMRTADAQTPVILITAFPSEETRDLARQLGALMLAKPFDIDELRRAVASFAPRRPARAASQKE